MAWIKTVAPDEADGLLGRIYEAAVKRAGRVFQIVRASSLSPRITQSALGIYQSVMFAPEGLSRRQRELLAVVTSRANACHY